ncbi:MAG: Asp-tRNA(Asn)/Glu-tRNA(Gln) amidotransferase GatCAB subunit B, partial [Fibrobacteres bacterium]|nr:Asp-tRNA(Asn)/Glu-tRNA(Gln) amidotransferase GatCAB subunit B [Fibrobacterota bacterium]
LSAIQPLIEKIVADNPSQVSEYRSGKKKILGFFVGEAMKVTKGKANPKIVNEILEKLLA